MNNIKILLSFILLTSLINCGKNEPKDKSKKETNLSQSKKNTRDTTSTVISDLDAELNQSKENNDTTNTNRSNKNNFNETGTKTSNSTTNLTPAKQVEKVINSPLRNLLKQGQLGKSYTKDELISNYKFPKEAVDLIKQVTYVGENKLYFKWGSTWFVEKVSDAKFKNDTLHFVFKQNKTYVSGGAIGIKYNKKIYTELILNNGAAYIPSVKGYHWDIGK